ncbi:MAG: hypothetical protein ACRCZI_01665, partial [Cetobacterium sp.]
MFLQEYQEHFRFLVTNRNENSCRNRRNLKILQELAQESQESGILLRPGTKTRNQEYCAKGALYIV